MQDSIGYCTVHTQINYTVSGFLNSALQVHVSLTGRQSNTLGRRLATRNRNRYRKLLISRAPTKAKSQEPAYSQALNQNKIDRQRPRSRESVRQTVRRLWWMVFGV